MKNAVRNWMTSLAGLAVLAIAISIGWRDPARWADPQVVALFALGSGLIAAQDANASGRGERGPKPQDPPRS